MNKSDYYNLEFLNYDEISKILYDKFKATDDEIRFWIKQTITPLTNTEQDDIDSEYNYLPVDSLLIPFVSDLPFDGDRYSMISDDFFYPEYCYYVARDVHMFQPRPHHRLIYYSDLASKRNWAAQKIDDSSPKKFSVLKNAQRAGLLRCFDKELNEFTFHKTFKSQKQESKRLWVDTDEGLDILSNPESFFLLEDILKIERCIFRKDRDACLKELQINLVPPNIKLVSMNDKINT